MPNFFSDNSDILFQLNRLDLKEIVNVLEDNYNESKNYNYAPVNFGMNSSFWSSVPNLLRISAIS